MKLFGGKGNKKKSGSGRRDSSRANFAWEEDLMLTPDEGKQSKKVTKSAAVGGDSTDKRGEASYSKKPASSPDKNTDKLVSEYGAKKKKKRRTWLIVIGVIVLLLLAAFIWYRLWSQPPAVNPNGPTTPNVEQTPTPTADLAASPSPSVAPTDDPNDPRKPGCYTFLIVGLDQVGNNTDTIMVGMLDTTNHALNVVSIPRDTLANVSWGTKRINTIYAAAINNGKDGVQALKDGIRDMLGFEVDSYAVVDLTAFVELVDAIGGVDYDVPVDMYYDAPDQGLHIAIPAGPTHLDGTEALKVVRFRAGYANADLGRIETQQDFLKTVAKQMLTLGNIPNLPEFINIYNEYVNTDLTGGNLAFYIEEFLKIAPEDIDFHTVPNVPTSIRSGSYLMTDIDVWLEMVNEYLNPWKVEITEANLNMLGADASGNLYSTTGVIAGGMDSFTDYSQYLNG